jgi:hypothetical protein
LSKKKTKSGFIQTPKADYPAISHGDVVAAYRLLRWLNISIGKQQILELAYFLGSRNRLFATGVIGRLCQGKKRGNRFALGNFHTPWGLNAFFNLDPASPYLKRPFKLLAGFRFKYLQHAKIKRNEES